MKDSKEVKITKERKEQEAAVKEETEKVEKKEPTTSEETQTTLAEMTKKEAYIESERLKELKEKVDEAEKRLDEKIASFKRFVDNTEIGGKSLVTAPEKTQDEKATEDANKFLEGTGLKI